jgi:hypothetical protein
MFESPQQKALTEAWLKEYNGYFETDLNFASVGYLPLETIIGMKMDVILIKVLELGLNPCPCLKCLKKRDQKKGLDFQSVMQSCPVCGNKRCPKATDHDLDCTHSNEPGQAGSSYNKR